MKLTIDTQQDDQHTVLSVISLLVGMYQLGSHIAEIGQAAQAVASGGRPEDVFGAAPPEAGVPFASPAAAPASAPPPAAPAAPATAPAAPEPTHTTVSPPPAEPAAPPPPAAVERDSSGMPWDARIHAGNKATVKDGTWRKKPGVDKATISAVEAELRPQAPAAPAAVTPPPPPAPAPAAAPSAPPPPPAASAAPAPAPTPAPPVSSPGAYEPGSSPDAPKAARFAWALKRTTNAQTEGRLTPETVLGLVQAINPEFKSLSEVLAKDLGGQQPGGVETYIALLDGTLG